MDPIQAAIEAIDSRELGEHFTYKEYAKKFNIDRFTPQQELELIRYIEGLTKRGLPPTREMIRNFSSEIVKYRLYFELLHRKIEEYNIEPGNTYNIDKKGILIGLISRSKRIFSRRQWDKKEVRAPLQDRSREFITVLACCCADGSFLLPSLIYAAKKGVIQSSWVDAIDLKQVFNRCTKQKACRGRNYWLLILDSYGSHLTMDFISYCDRHRILLIVFPPYLTYTLQPLDVAQGLVSIAKGDFFDLLRHSLSDWLQMERLVRAAVKDPCQDEAKRLSLTLYQLSVQNQLLQHEVKGLHKALRYKKKHKKKGKALNLQQRQEYYTRAKKQREEARLQRQVKLEERRAERERLKVVREKEKAEKQAKREPVSSKEKRQKRVGDAAGSVQVPPALSPPPPWVTSRGRNVKLLSKFR
ncbi:hypothetical protein HBI23_218330 [Parastagonospora nodorum]|nr:hypothetical protein HBI23_218330 [Parastagonospora nodorum]